MRGHVCPHECWLALPASALRKAAGSGQALANDTLVLLIVSVTHFTRRFALRTHRHTATGASSPAHPLDSYFAELLARRRAELSERGTAVTIKSAMSQRRLASLSAAARMKNTAAGSQGHTLASPGLDQSQTEGVGSDLGGRGAHAMPEAGPSAAGDGSAPGDSDWNGVGGEWVAGAGDAAGIAGEDGAIPEELPLDVPDEPAREITEEERTARGAQAGGLGALGGRRPGLLPPIGEGSEARGVGLAVGQGSSGAGVPVALDAVRRLSLQRQSSRNRAGFAQDGPDGERGRSKSNEAAAPGSDSVLELNGPGAEPNGSVAGLHAFMHQLYPPPLSAQQAAEQLPGSSSFHPLPAHPHTLMATPSQSSQSSSQHSKHVKPSPGSFSLTGPPDKSRWSLGPEAGEGRGSKKGVNPDARPLPPPPPSYWQGPLTNQVGVWQGMLSLDHSFTFQGTAVRCAGVHSR